MSFLKMLEERRQAWAARLAAALEGQAVLGVIRAFHAQAECTTILDMLREYETAHTWEQEEQKQKRRRVRR